MRSPVESASLMISSICFRASSTSFAGRCFCFAVMISISSDFVMRASPLVEAANPCRDPQTVVAASSVAVAAADLFFQQITEARAARGLVGAIALYGLGLLVRLFRLDGERDGARLAVDARELRFDLIALLQHGARVLDAVTTELGSAQLSFHPVAEVDDGAARVHFLDDSAHDAALG